jgi:hypothetical protein
VIVMMRVFVIAGAVWALAVGAAQAQLAPAPAMPQTAAAEAPKPIVTLSDAPMQVVLVRSGPPGCEPHCSEWIAAQGQIDKTTLPLFRKVLAQIGDRRPPVLIHSGGGSVPDAIAVGRLIRAKGLDVAVAKTEFTVCAPADAECRKRTAKGALIGTPKAYVSVCASACPLIVAGGTRRYVGQWALLGVHQIATFQKHYRILRTYQVTTRRPGWGAPVEVKRTLIGEKKIGEKTVQTATSADVYEKVREHLVAMGVSDELMPLLSETPNSSMRWLTRDELVRMKMATDIGVNGEQLIAALTAPKPVPAPVPAVTIQDLPPAGPPMASLRPSILAAVAPAAPPAADAALASVPTVPPLTLAPPAAAVASAPVAALPPDRPRKVTQARRPALAVAKSTTPAAPIYDFNRTR